MYLAIYKDGYVAKADDDELGALVNELKHGGELVKILKIEGQVQEVKSDGSIKPFRE